MRPGRFRHACAALCLVLVTVSGYADYRAGIEAYRNGDFEGAFEAWREVAGEPPGSVDPEIRAEASYALGMLYWLGQGVGQDSTQSARWLAQAADAGHAGAQSKLGYLYLVGQGVPQNDFEALKWLRMAAHQGDADAQYNLGVMYRDGQGVPASPQRALEWFSEAASRGDAMAAGVLQAYERTGVLEPLTTPVPAGESAATPSGKPAAPAAGSPNVTEAPDPSPAQKVATYRKESEQVNGKAPAPAWPGTVQQENWIAAREPGHYTIQVIAVRQTEGVKDFVNKHPELAPFAVFRQGSADAPLWVLIQGDYASAAEARSAWRGFPTEIQPRDNLWIRPFADIQRQLR